MMSTKKSGLAAHMDHILTVPVDPAVFEFAIPLFQAAASGAYPDAHIKPAQPDDGPGFRLTNIPMNRGMLAVMKETKHLSQDEREALVMRLMHFGDAFVAARADPRFAEHVKDGQDDAVLVSDAFQRGVAVCAFKVTDDHVVPDMDDLWERIKDEPLD
jgi:hypothetical protein